MATNKTEQVATDGGRFNQHILSPLEESLANIFDLQKQLNPEGRLQGVQQQDNTN